MKILAIANIVAVLVAAWAAWELRLTTFRSRWDSPKTTALILFVLAAILDSPWRVMSEASFSYTGRFYFFTVIGHICYLAACASGLKYIYLRLLPDAAIGPFVRRRLVPAVFIASAIMVVAFTASPLTASLSADHLYLVHPDGWLKLYWLTFYGTLTSILLAAMYGLNRLRSDPRSVQLKLLLTSLGLGAMSAVVSGVGLLNGHGESVRLFAWPLTYAAIALGAVAVVLSWRHRVWTMLQPRDDR
jgi:hypothetical protein